MNCPAAESCGRFKADGFPDRLQHAREGRGTLEDHSEECVKADALLFRSAETGREDDRRYDRSYCKKRI